MKRDGKMLICLAGGLVLSANARAVTADEQDNPYLGIIERNVFALKPPPDPSTLKTAESEPPKITPQGIMSMFGRQQVLFKTLMPGSKPGGPPQETAMLLSVGQREGEIEVVAIDESAGTITFNNHGKEQTLNLEKDGPKLPTSPAVAPPQGIGVPRAPGVPPPAAAALNPSQGGPPAVTPTPFGGGTAGSTLKNIPTRTLRLPSPPGTSVPAQATAATTPTPQTPQPTPLSPEEQVAIMLLNQNQDGPPMPPIQGINE